MQCLISFSIINLVDNWRGNLMILDTMTYSVMTVVAILSFVVIILAAQHNQSQQDKSDK